MRYEKVFVILILVIVVLIGYTLVNIIDDADTIYNRGAYATSH